MFADQLSTAIDAAPVTANHLADLSRQVWQAWSSGLIDDDRAQAAAARIAEKRGIICTGAGSNNAPTTFLRARADLQILPKRRIPKSPDRERSLARSRKLAASGGLPGRIAQHFPLKQQAALYIVLSDVRDRGVCSACLDQISARAGVSRSTVKRAIRKAASLGILLSRERRRAGQRSLPNIIHCISQDVRTWWRMKDKGASPKRILNTGIRGGSQMNPTV